MEHYSGQTERREGEVEHYSGQTEIRGQLHRGVRVVEHYSGQTEIRGVRLQLHRGVRAKWNTTPVKLPQCSWPLTQFEIRGGEGEVEHYHFVKLSLSGQLTEVTEGSVPLGTPHASVSAGPYTEA